MLRRIFIAINLPESAKKELILVREKWPELPARWTEPQNLHVTLVFYGSAVEQELEAIQQKTKEVAKSHAPFPLKFSRIAYGPFQLRSGQAPRMIWAVGDATKDLLNLQQELAQSLERIEQRPFSLHVTLARFNGWQFRSIEPEERPSIDEEINIEVPVHSIEIMESKLKRTGAEYTILESYSLKNY